MKGFDCLPGVANVGVNPTTGHVAARLEVHLFDFDRNIYGEAIETELIAFLRPEEQFHGVDILVEQMKRDAQAAKLLLGPGGKHGGLL